MTRRLMSWLAVMMIGAAAFLYGAIDEGTPRTDADRAYALAKTFGCPACTGQSVADSDAPVARAMRASIARWIDEGRSTDFIRTEFVANFGEDVDYTPSNSGVTSLVWILPVVFGAVAVAGLVVVFRRWHDEGELEATAADRALVDTARAAADNDG